MLKCVLVCLGLFAPVAALADVTGIWRTEESDLGGYALVDISACTDGTGDYCGTIVDIINNPNRSSIGLEMITAMEDRGNGKYRGGKIYAPDQDKWYNARMNLDGDILAVYGCVAGGLICRGQDWTRP